VHFLAPTQPLKFFFSNFKFRVVALVVAANGEPASYLQDKNEKFIKNEQNFDSNFI
jgi:hypothetical protein